MQTPEADAALPPARHRCSPRRRNQWAVTCVDDRGYKSLLAPFLGSLISVAGWRGRIAVFDYGLSAARVARLRELGIHVEPVEQQHLLMVDRFIHLTQFAKQNEGVIGMWDADVWFTEAVDDLFDTYREKHGGRLLCNWDAGFQTSCYDPAHDLATRKRIDRVLLPLLREHGTVPQCGFLCGTTAVLARFGGYLAHLLARGEFALDWNSDTLGLCYFYTHHRRHIEVIDSRYNCLPDCYPARLGDSFYFQGRRMRALHVTSPWRASRRGAKYRFQNIYPNLHEKWRETLGL